MVFILKPIAQYHHKSCESYLKSNFFRRDLQDCHEKKKPKKVIMKKNYFIIILIFCSLAFLISISANHGSSPKLAILKDTWNFGKITEGRKVTHTFTLFNLGDTNLFIDSVTPTCECTTAEISITEIPPGMKAEIKVIFNSKGEFGNYQGFIMISSNDPEKPVQRIRINGEILKNK